MHCFDAFRHFQYFQYLEPSLFLNSLMLHNLCPRLLTFVCRGHVWHFSIGTEDQCTDDSARRSLDLQRCWRSYRLRKQREVRSGEGHCSKRLCSALNAISYGPLDL